MKALVRVLWLSVRYRMDRHLPAKLYPWWAKFPLFLIKAIPCGSLGRDTADFFQAAGPLFIKLGQHLSTRVDMFDAEILEQTGRLTDSCTPIAYAHLEQHLQELGYDLKAIFSSIDETPVATASLAQIHRGQLQLATGEYVDIAIKILKPGIKEQLNENLGVLNFCVARLKKFPAFSHQPIEAIVEDFSRTLLGECDLLAEAARTERMRDNALAAQAPSHYARIYWPQCNAHFMTAEWLDAIPVNDTKTLDAYGINRKKLAERGLAHFYRQVLYDNFFHGDMHSGNVMVSKHNPEDPSFLSVDCAVTGSLSDQELDAFATMIQALMTKQYTFVAKILFQMGWQSHADTSSSGSAQAEADLAVSLQALVEPIINKPLNEISLSQLLRYLIVHARRHSLTMKPSHALLFKTLLNVEGLGKLLYPQLNIWSLSLESIEKWQSSENRAKRLAQRLPIEVTLLRLSSYEWGDAIQKYLHSLSQTKSRTD